MSTKTEATSSSVFEDTFPNIPPFPTDIPTAPLIRVSLSKLQNNDKVESERLFAASKDLGFFYLDLRDDELLGKEMLSQADQLFHVGEELFSLGREELSKYDYRPQGSYFGYKGIQTAVTDAKGTLDWNEFYNVCLSIHSRRHTHGSLSPSL